MKELINKHKEAIEDKHLDAIIDSYYLGVFDRVQAARSCALITQKHGEIQRLEGMIEVYKYVIYNRPEPYDIRPRFKELEKQLKEFKGE